MKVKNIMFSGFMAVILMGVAGNASAAAVQIASKAYVDGELASKASNADLGAANEAIAQNAENIAKKADQTYVGTLPTGITATDIVGYIQEKTAGIATEGAMTELSGRVTAAEGKVTALEGKMTTAEGDIDALESAMTGTGEGSVAAKISDAVSTAKSELTTEIDKKADSSTVDGISGRVTALEGAGYQNAGQVSGAITNALVGYATEDYVGTQIQSATENMATDAEVQSAINALSAEGGEIANLSGTVDGIGARVTTAEGEIDTLQSEMDAVEAKAAANETAIGNKQDKLSENQLKAVNSGITAELRATYDTAVTQAAAALPAPTAACAQANGNCVLSIIGGNIQWVDITAPLQ